MSWNTLSTIFCNFDSEDFWTYIMCPLIRGSSKRMFLLISWRTQLLVWLQSFLMCRLRDTDMQPNGRLVGQDQREGWKSKGIVYFKAQHSTVTSSVKKRKKVNSKPGSSSPEGKWLCLASSLYCTPFSWHSQTKGLLACLLKPPPPLFHQHLLPFKATFILGHSGEKEKKKTSGQWNCLVTQKGVIIEINHPILFHN